MGGLDAEAAREERGLLARLRHGVLYRKVHRGTVAEDGKRVRKYALVRRFRSGHRRVLLGALALASLAALSTMLLRSLAERRPAQPTADYEGP